MQLSATDPSVGTLAPRARFTTSLPALDLNGDWRFRYSERYADAPADFADPELDDHGWDELPVPSSWPLPGRGRTGYGLPAYTNVKFPFPVDPPYPPDENPVGDHRRTFEAGPEFAAGARLRFDGIDNTGEVWLNGTRLGQTRGSRLVQEFDVSGVLVAGHNLLAVRVAQFSASSYLEDQDMWWLPGIFRDVTLLAHPVGAVEDLFVHADLEPDGTGRLRIQVTGPDTARWELPELGISGGPEETITVGPVQGWTAETPRRYALIITTAVETITEQVGFRTVSWDGVLTVNGAPIMIRGVNRHEFDPDHGRVVPYERLRSELRLMKQHNVNAIRTSHYPPHPDLLELADEFGFWVIDECDLETHGFYCVDWRRNPSDDPQWQAAYLDRMRRTVERDKNRPCVIGWSLGNESHTGANLAAMAAWTKERDPSRFVHYEGDWDSPYVDVYSRMYASHEEVTEIGARTEPVTDDDRLDAHRRGLPFLQCEYVHAMGNGPGGMTEYQQLFDDHDRLAGGFVWEWLEHGIRADHHGVPFFAYGGDFGEAVHDGNFVCDGLVDADRTPRPGLVDWAHVVAPVSMIIAADWSAVELINRYDHSDLSELVLQWWIAGPNGMVASGPVGTLHCPPHGRIEVPLPDEVKAQRPDGPGVLTVSVVMGSDVPWASVGHELAWADAGTLALPRDEPAAPGTIPVVTDQGWELGPARFDRTGRLVVLGGHRVQGPEIGLWRAPTDNDLGRDTVRHRCDADDWAEQGLDRLRTRVLGVAVEEDALVVRHRVGAAIRDAALDVAYRWTGSADGRVRVGVSVTVGEHWGETWARLGLDLTLDDSWRTVAWEGYGPLQRYPDTGQGQRLGWWESGVAAIQVPYVRPQDNGSREVLGRLTLIGPDRQRLVIGSTGGPFAFTARPWSATALAAADHPYDLLPDGRLRLSLDHARHGIGTAACGPGVLPAYRLEPAALAAAPVEFGFTFELG